MIQKSLAKNAIYNFLYIGVNTLFPLMTAPYVSRILGVSNLGEVDFAKSIVSWFMLFAAFGTTSYGIREIAKNRNNKKDMSKVFTELVVINTIMSIVAAIAYFGFIFNFNQFNEELPLFVVMSLTIILNVFNIDWFYQGIEEYSYITFRNGVIKAISLVAIFLFIKSEGDYILYGLISIIATSISGILNVIHSRKFIKINIKKINLFSHFKQLLTFFFIGLVINIYTNLDRTLLGFYIGAEAVAYMVRSKTITNIAISISTSISTVTMPRASYYLKEDINKFNNLLNKIPKFILIITIPITIGLVLLAPELMFILGGNEFLQATNLLRVISPLIIFSSLSTFLQSQILIPTGNENIGLKSSIIASIVSLIFNITLIPKYGYIGAGVAVVLAEFTAFITKYIASKKLGYIDLRFINKSSLTYFSGSIIMCIPILIIKYYFDAQYIIVLILSVISGVVFYFSFLYITNEKLMIDLFQKVKSKIL